MLHPQSLQFVAREVGTPGAPMIEAVESLGNSVFHVHEQFPIPVRSNRIQIDGSRGPEELLLRSGKSLATLTKTTTMPRNAAMSAVWQVGM